MSSVRKPHGRLFQIRGPAAPKLNVQQKQLAGLASLNAEFILN